MSALYVGDRDISWRVGFQFHAKQCPYIWSFDTEFSNFAPGKLHVGLAIEGAFRKHQDAFDFGMDVESYKFDWIEASNMTSPDFRAKPARRLLR